MQSPMSNAGLFLINTFFDLYLFVLTIRLILCWVRADFFNPFSQFIIKLTQRIILPLRKIIPNKMGIELSTVLVILVIELIKYLLISLLIVGLPNVSGLLVLSVADMLKLILNTFFYAIFFQAILTWVHQAQSPVGLILNQMTAPIMRPFQRLIPPVSGFDLSPIPALIVLQLMMIVFVNPLMSIGAGM